MTDEQLDRLGKLTSIFDLCAKMGGTKPLEKVQQYVSEDMTVLLKEIEDDKNAEKKDD